MLFDRERLPEFLKATYLFNRLEVDVLEEIANHVSVLSFKAGSRIYPEHSKADELYLIYSGNVHLVNALDGKNMVEIQSGGVFGKECLVHSEPFHHFSAIATEASIVLEIKKDFLQELSLDIPDLKENITILGQSYEKILRKQPSWLNAGEFLIHIVRKNITTFFSSLIAPVLFISLILLGSMFLPEVLGIPSHKIAPWMLAFFSLIVLWGFLLFFNWYNEYFVITNQRILLLRRVFLIYETRQETPIPAILSVTTETDLVGRWLTFGTVTLRTFTGSIQFPKIDAPMLFVSILQYFLDLSRQEQRDSKQLEMEKYIRDRLNYRQSEPIINASPDLRVTTRPPGFFESLLGLREVTLESITYRTHWFVLVKKTFLPFLLGIGVISFLILRLSGYFFNLPANIVLLASSILSLGIWIWWLYEFVDWRNDIYIITSEKVIDLDRKPLGSERKREALLKNIQTIEYKRVGISGLLLNFGTVFIHVGDTDLTFDYISNPSEVQKELFERFMSSVLHEKQSKIESERIRMVEWLQAYRSVTGESSKKASGDNP
jgi:uncharacterized membrane protein YdbT with pleckstrin-like domain